MLTETNGETCRNCEDWIVWGRTANNRYEWTHKRTGFTACYPDTPVATPLRENVGPDE